MGRYRYTAEIQIVLRQLLLRPLPLDLPSAESIKRELQIPKELEIAAIIPFGYKGKKSKILKQETITITDRIHYENY